MTDDEISADEMRKEILNLAAKVVDGSVDEKTLREIESILNEDNEQQRDATHDARRRRSKETTKQTNSSNDNSIHSGDVKSNHSKNDNDDNDVYAKLSHYFDAMANVRSLEIQLDASAPALDELDNDIASLENADNSNIDSSKSLRWHTDVREENPSNRGFLFFIQP